MCTYLRLVMDAIYNKRIEAHLRKEGRREAGVTKRINLPGDTRPHAKVSPNVFMPFRYLIDDNIVVGVGFVVLNPAARHEFKSPRLDQCLHFGTHSGWLFIIPTRKEGTRASEAHMRHRERKRKTARRPAYISAQVNVRCASLSNSSITRVKMARTRSE